MGGKALETQAWTQLDVLQDVLAWGAARKPSFRLGAGKRDGVVRGYPRSKSLAAGRPSRYTGVTLRPGSSPG